MMSLKVPVTAALKGEARSHGSVKSYEFYGCRCALCWAAGVKRRAQKREYMRDYMAEYRARNKEKLRIRNREWMRKYRAALRAAA